MGVSGNDEQLRLLHVHAHPDDESSKGAATTARYVAEGVRVMVATCTGGERGSILNPGMDTAENRQDIATLRRVEMAEAARILGIEHVWLGFVDSGLPEGDPAPPLPEGCFALMDVEEAAGALVRVIRAFRPQVVTTYDEEGGYPHPDHIMCHRVTMAAVTAAADPGRWPEHGEPWQVAKVYYDMSLHRDRLAALDSAMHAHGFDRALRRLVGGVGRGPRAPGAVDHLRAVCRLLRGQGRRPVGARQPDRPGRSLVRGAVGDPARGLADRGVPTGVLDRAVRTARSGSVRRVAQPAAR